MSLQVLAGTLDSLLTDSFLLLFAGISHWLFIKLPVCSWDRLSFGLTASLCAALFYVQVDSPSLVIVHSLIGVMYVRLFFLQPPLFSCFC